jgi:hypothetical protein
LNSNLNFLLVHTFGCIDEETCDIEVIHSSGEGEDSGGVFGSHKVAVNVG